MRNQLLSELQVDGIWDESADSLEERVSITLRPTKSDRQTGSPVYAIMVRSADGVIRPLTGKDGLVAAWRPNWATSPTAQQRQKEMNKSVSSARAKHLKKMTKGK